MAVTGVFYVSDQSSSALSGLTDRLQKSFDPAPLGRWSLAHYIFRSTPASPSDKSNPRYQHVLNLGHHPARTYVCIDNQPIAVNGSSKDVTTIALPWQERESYCQLISSKMNALWTPRMGLVVNNGATFDLGEFIVRAGEIRPSNNTQAIRGVIVAIQAKADPSRDEATSNRDANGGSQVELVEDLEATKEIIRALWKTFGVEKAREVFTEKTSFQNKDEESFEEVRLWCDALRTRT